MHSPENSLEFADLQQPCLRSQCRNHFLVMSQLVAELMDERPCTNEVVVHVRRLVVHGFPVFDNQSV